jgi:hypothetical protein
MIDAAIMERENMRSTERVGPTVSSATREALESDCHKALKLLPELLLSAPLANLPIFATANDVREVVRFLNKRPQGITIVEATNADQRRIFEPRKISAYEFWGIISRTGERLMLSSLGHELAQKLEPETRVYRRVLSNTELYRSVLEWLYQQSLQLVTHLNVAAYWQDYHAETVGQYDDKSLEGHVVCFFHLCQAAGLGLVTLGKRGQLTRLRVEQDELEAYLIEGSFAGSVEPAIEEDQAARDEHSLTNDSAGGRVKTPIAERSSPEKMRVFISTGRETKLVPQLHAALDLADIECLVLERETVGESPLPADVFRAMRECDAALMVLNDEDFKSEDGGRILPVESLLIEIGAAFALYGRRVLLLHEGQLPVPANLLGLCCYRFGGDELTWDEGVQLIKAFKAFKRDGSEVF